MKLKVASLLLLGLGWSPNIVWFILGLYFRTNSFYDSVITWMELLLTIIILPGCGGFLAGWCWRWHGLLISLTYIGSALLATPIYLEISSFIFNRFPIPPERLPEGPTGLLLIDIAIPGTVVALIGALVGIVVWLIKKSMIKQT